MLTDRSFAFPPMPAELFNRLARVPCEEKFILENKALGIAEIGLGRCHGKSSAKTFCARSFDAEYTYSLSPRWEISLRADGVCIRRHFDTGEALTPEQCERELQNLLEATPETDAESMPEIPAPSEIGGDWYPASARKLIDAIHAGELKKIVLARSIESRAASPIPAAPILRKLRERFGRNCTIFAITRDGKTFLGATPETLVRLRNGLVETEALAGSVPNAPDADLAERCRRFIEDDKERREHRAVVDFIAEKLSRMGLSPEFPETPEVAVLPNILHLRTPISARACAPIHVLDLVSALHPTPAMCGVPADRAREKILSTEPFARGHFAGPLGFYDASGEGFFAVGIRCAEIDGETIRLFAGSGLVAGSVPEREFAEIDNKFSALLTSIAKS